jgi:riboflavin kinase/FMN adenylyltransferase
MSVLHGDPHKWQIQGTIGSAVAIGTFDGVHKGHQRVLADLRSTSGLVPAALTFDIHPLGLIDPERAPRLLGTVDQRVEWLQEEGAELVGVLPFAQVREWSPQAFVDVVLRTALRAEVVAVGSDFRFGYGRRGDVAMLRDAGADHGFAVHVVDLLGEGDGKFSSTEIRRAMEVGDVVAARAILGRPPTLRGPVVRGEGRGRQIGIPTANVATKPMVQLPALGVYAGVVIFGRERHDAVINVGRRPTFDGEGVTVEAHLIDWDGDLYGRSLDVELHVRLRGEVRFDSVDSLVAQIRRDIEAARIHLAG